MLGYNQNLVIDHLNQYLELNGRDLHLKYGYCHGLSLLWLYCMSTKQEAWFYQTIRDLVNAVTPADYAEITPRIEKFLSHIEWLQHSADYLIGTNQLDVDRITEGPPKFAFSYLFYPQQLDALIMTLIVPEKMIALSGANHSIGLYMRDGAVYLFDPNYQEGAAKVFTTTESLREEIINCLFYKVGLTSMPCPILFNMLDPTDATQQVSLNKAWLHQTLLKIQPNLNMRGTNGITALYAACDNRDIDQIRFLLANGANPNLVTDEGLSPLHIAALRGYDDIAELLLKYGANINLTTKRAHTALSLATCFGHDKLVELLIQHQASVHHKVNRLTCLQMALDNGQWACALVYLKFNYPVNREEKKLLLKHQQSLFHTMHAQWETYDTTEKYYLSRYFSLEPQHKPFSFFKQIFKQKVANDPIIKIIMRR